MSEADWSLFDSLTKSLAATAPTQARAHGSVLSALMHSANLPQVEPGALHWMDWERRKTLRLLLSRR